jgi:hypothetical protein
VEPLVEGLEQISAVEIDQEFHARDIEIRCDLSMGGVE